MAFGKNIAKSGEQAERIMSQRGLDSPPQDMDSQDPAPQGQASAPVQEGTPVNPFGGAAFSQEVSRPSVLPSRPAAPTRPAPAPAPAPTTRPAAFGRPQPPSRLAPGPVSQANRPQRPAHVGRPVDAAPARPPQSAHPAPVATAAAFGASSAASEPRTVQAPEGLGDLFQGYTKMVAATSRREDGLPLRLERLIDEVSDFQGYDDARREEAKKRALTDPKAWDKKLTDYYLKTIRPHRAKTAHTLEEARQKHPGKVVYLLVEKGEQSVKVFDRNSERGRQEALLDGATIETVFSSRTPFPPPKEVFGAADVSQEVAADAVEDAFSRDSQTSFARPPRP